MKINKKNSVLMMVLLMIILVSVSIGEIMAYLTDVDTAVNDLTVGGNNIVIEEVFNPEPIMPGQEIEKKVYVKNDGPNNCYIRVRAVFSDSDVGKYTTIDWNSTDWSYNAEDEFYYYKHPITVGETTSALMTKIIIANSIPSNMIKNADLIIYAESYQADDFLNYQTAWADYRKNIK